MSQRSRLESEPSVEMPLTAWLSEIPQSRLHGLLSAAMNHAAHGLSTMVGYPVKVENFRVRTLPISEVTRYADDPEAEVVGIHVLIRGGYGGQALLLLSVPGAANLANMLVSSTLQNEAGAAAANWPGALAQSALGEAGNIVVSYFLNAVTDFLGQRRPLPPSPPAVTIERLATLVDRIAAPLALTNDELLITTCQMEARVSSSDDAQALVHLQIWILPEPIAGNREAS